MAGNPLALERTSGFRAAVRSDLGGIYVVPRPLRHDKALAACYAAEGSTRFADQGFAAGPVHFPSEFITRREAWRIATLAGLTTDKAVELFTEDLW